MGLGPFFLTWLFGALTLPTTQPTQPVANASERGQLVASAINEWGAVQNYEVTPGANNLMSKQVLDTYAGRLTKANSSLTKEEEKNVIRGMAAVYLDAVCEVPRARGGKCVVNAERLSVFSVPAFMGDPKTGTLDVDGTTQGATIFIDGKQKGVVRQAFIVSVGHHVWKTMGCEEKVTIDANQYKNVRCEKQ